MAERHSDGAEAGLSTNFSRRARSLRCVVLAPLGLLEARRMSAHLQVGWRHPANVFFEIITAPAPPATQSLEWCDDGRAGAVHKKNVSPAGCPTATPPRTENSPRLKSILGTLPRFRQLRELREKTGASRNEEPIRMSLSPLSHALPRSPRAIREKIGAWRNSELGRTSLSRALQV